MDGKLRVQARGVRAVVIVDVVVEQTLDGELQAQEETMMNLIRYD